MEAVAAGVAEAAGVVEEVEVEGGNAVAEEV